MILSRRANDDDHRDGFTKWPFMTTHSWGEYPQGTWKLEVVHMWGPIFSHVNPNDSAHRHVSTPRKPDMAICWNGPWSSTAPRRRPTAPCTPPRRTPSWPL